MGQAYSLHDCRDVRLEGSTLHALTPHHDQYRGGLLYSGTIAEAERMGETLTHWIPASFPLDQVIGNHEGHLVWGLKNFSRSAQNIALSGTVLSADLRSVDGSVSHSSLDLDKLIVGVSGTFTANGVPVMIQVPKDDNEKIVSHIRRALEADPTASLSAINYPDGKTTFVLGNPHRSVGDKDGIYLAQVAHASDEGKMGYLSAEFSTTDDPTAFFTTTLGEVKASVFHVANSQGRPIKSYEVDMASTNRNFVINTVRGGEKGQATSAGIDARINLIDMKASLFDLNLAYGVENGVGIKDYSLSVRPLEEGFMVGRQITISSWGSTFGVDLGWLFA